MDSPHDAPDVVLPVNIHCADTGLDKRVRVHDTTDAAPAAIRLGGVSIDASAGGATHCACARLQLTDHASRIVHLRAVARQHEVSAAVVCTGPLGQTAADAPREEIEQRGVGDTDVGRRVADAFAAIHRTDYAADVEVHVPSYCYGTIDLGVVDAVWGMEIACAYLLENGVVGISLLTAFTTQQADSPHQEIGRKRLVAIGGHVDMTVRQPQMTKIALHASEQTDGPQSHLARRDGCVDVHA